MKGQEGPGGARSPAVWQRPAMPHPPPTHLTPNRVAKVWMPYCLSPSTSGRSLVIAMAVANTVTKAVMKLQGGGGGGQGGTEGLSERLAGARGRGHSARRRWQQRHRGKSMAGRRAGLGGGWQAGLALSRDDGVPSEGQPQGRPRSVVDPKVQQEAADLCGAGAGGRGRGTLVEGVLWTQSSAGSRGPARGRRQGAGAGVRTVVEGVWPAGLAANPPLHPPHLPSHPTHLHPTSIPPTAAMMRKAATAERLRRSGGTL